MLFYKKPDFDKMSYVLLDKAKQLNDMNMKIMSLVRYKDFNPNPDDYVINNMKFCEDNSNHPLIYLYKNMCHDLVFINEEFIQKVKNGEYYLNYTSYLLSKTECEIMMIYLYLLGFDFKYKIVNHKYNFGKYNIRFKICTERMHKNYISHYGIKNKNFTSEIIEVRNINIKFHNAFYIFKLHYKKIFESKIKYLHICDNIILCAEDDYIDLVINQLYPNLICDKIGKNLQIRKKNVSSS